MWFSWLSAPSAVRSTVEKTTVNFRNKEEELPTVVKIKKCRFLSESGDCVGMCTNLCKVPAQRFFTGA